MSDEVTLGASENFFQHPSVKRWVPFLLKAVVVLGLLYFLSNILPVLPSWCLAIIWAILSSASAAGIAYPWVISKTHKQSKYEEGSLLARFNGGRFFTILVSFVLGAVFASGLIAESPKWDLLEWCVVALSTPLYLLVGILVRKYLTRQFKPTFREPGIMTWTGGITAVLLCVMCLALLIVFQPELGATNATEAFLYAEQPFAESPSALMVEFGKLTALIDGLSMFGIAKIAEVSMGWAMIGRLILYASSFCAITSLLSLCSLERGEHKRIYQTLANISSPDQVRVLVKRFAGFAAVLPICLVVVFVVSDIKVDQVAQTDEYTYAEQVVRSQASLAVYTLDGKYYDKQEVKGLLERAQSESEALSEDARETIVPLINASFDKRLENVDDYLDWYYGLPADYERLVNMVAGSAESYAADQFAAKIEAGVDDTGIATKLEDYSQQAEEVKKELMSELAGYEKRGVPQWLVSEENPLDTNFLDTSFKSTNHLFTSSERFGFSAVGGIVTGVIAKKVAEKALAKPFFGKVVSKIASVLGTRAAGSAVGGAAGSLAGPAGTVVGVIAGTAAGIVIDYGLLALDEMQNRDSYRQEIVDAIEESRADALAIFQ